MEADTFLSILEEATDSTATLTQGELDFLVNRAGIPAEAFEPDHASAAQLAIELQVSRANEQAAEGLTTTEVAEVLGIAPANVRRAAANGDLFASSRRKNRELVFPAWQFAGGRMLPNLRQVLNAFVVPMHPLDVEAFMSTAREELGNRTGIEWLQTGGAPEVLVRMAADEGRL